MKRCCDTDELITDMLHKLGIPSHYKGFKYIKEMIYLILQDENITINLKDDLYKMVAYKYKTNESNVERNVRYAIEIGYGRANYSYQEELFQNSTNPLSNKQTNKEFLITVADKVKIQIDKKLDY